MLLDNVNFSLFTLLFFSVYARTGISFLLFSAYVSYVLAFSSSAKAFQAKDQAIAIGIWFLFLSCQNMALRDQASC